MKLSSLTRTRKGRVALAVVPTAVVATVLMAGVANGAVPVSFAISGTQFQVAASTLDGTGFSQYGSFQMNAAGKPTGVALTNIEDAKLYNLCQSVVQPTPFGTKLGLMITAGGGKDPAHAKDMQIGMADMKGDATFHNMRIGVDASTVNTTAKGTPGAFAQDADAVTITGLQQTAYSVTAGTFDLKGLHLALTGGDTCF